MVYYFLSEKASSVKSDDLSHASVQLNKTEELKLKPYFSRFQFIIAKLKAIGYFLTIRSKGHKLISINISNCGLTDFACAMASVVISETHISEFHYSNNIITFYGAQHLASAILKSPYIRTMVLQNNQLSDNAIKSLCHSVTQSPSMLTLDLSRNSIGPAGASWISGIKKEFFLDTLTLTGAMVNKSETSGGRTELEDAEIFESKTNTDPNDNSNIIMLSTNSSFNNSKKLKEYSKNVTTNLDKIKNADPLFDLL